jgi:hypothetical protein
LTFNTTVVGNNPASQTLAISNGGDGTLNWTLTDDAAWLSCSPTSGTNSASVTVSVDKTGLGAGTYNGTITITDPNASNSPVTVPVTLTVIEQLVYPEIRLDKDRLNFGAIEYQEKLLVQSFLIDNSGDDPLNWTVTDDVAWLSCTPASGTGAASVTAAVDASALSAGTYTAEISVSDPSAVNSPQTIDVTLTVYEWGSDAVPFGSFETPSHGSTVRNSVPVTGWVLDDIGVESLKIYRENEAGTGLIYIGDALLVEGARPDIEQVYPGYPMNYKAGWGYMMLSNFLPDGGNGTFRLYAVATDTSGHEEILGTKTITCDNANAVKPFGAIDTPAAGGTASGSTYRNQGWVLTPMPNNIPTDGSTIDVYVDGVNLGHPLYNMYRSDIAALFPGYANSNGALAYFDIDTTQFSNGLHTIAWTAVDSAGNSDGIGSRYFTVQNTSGNRKHGAWSMEHGGGLQGTADVSTEPVEMVKGYKRNGEAQTIYPDDNGMINIEINQLERVEIHLVHPHHSSFITHHSRSLPIGSTLDMARGIFYWQPGPGFLGRHHLVFIESTQHGKMKRKRIVINITPQISHR